MKKSSSIRPLGGRSASGARVMMAMVVVVRMGAIGRVVIVVVIVVMVVIMCVIVMMTIQRQRLRRIGAEQRLIFRGGADRLRCAVAADMSVQTDHMIGCPHDDQQVVTDHQHRCAGFTPNLLDQAVKGDDTRLV